MNRTNGLYSASEHNDLLTALAEERDCRDSYAKDTDWYLEHDRRMVDLERAIERLVRF